MHVRHRWCALCTDQGFTFPGSPLLSFPFICTLYWCKHCTAVDVAPILRKFLFTALCVITAEGIVCRSITVGAHFAPTQGLRFQALNLLGFLFIRTLHWCKHCTGLDVVPNLRKFPVMALCVITAEGGVCMSVTVGAHFAPTKGLRFQVLHLLSFLFICTLHWCKHCTGLDVAPNLRKSPFMALCVIAAEGLVCRSALVGELFASTQG